MKTEVNRMLPMLLLLLLSPQIEEDRRPGRMARA
jgi:hypothetical protein